MRVVRLPHNAEPTVQISEIIPQAGQIQRLYCDKCAAMLDLAYARFDEEVSGINVLIDGLPVLRCPTCGHDHLPDRSRMAILHCHKQSFDAGKPSVTVTRRPLTERFGLTKIDFIYSADDYFYIPGLVRQPADGFLTPVFFNKHALLKYDTAPGYRIDFASRTYGSIITEDNIIPFGINRHDKLLMWLGDIGTLPESEQYYLRSENVESDHSLGSEFYEAQLECKFTDPTGESELLALRSKFLEACRSRYGATIAHLEDEVVALALSFNAPIVDTTKERRHVADTLNKIHVESLSAGELGKLIKKNGGDPGTLGNLKRLQMLLEPLGEPREAHSLMSPFFVTYDLRVAYVHLSSAAGAAELLRTVTARLGIAPDAGLLDIYAALAASLKRSYERLTGLVANSAP